MLFSPEKSYFSFLLNNIKLTFTQLEKGRHTCLYFFFWNNEPPTYCQNFSTTQKIALLTFLQMFFKNTFADITVFCLVLDWTFLAVAPILGNEKQITTNQELGKIIIVTIFQTTTCECAWFLKVDIVLKCMNLDAIKVKKYFE